MAILTERVDPNTPIARSLGFDPRGVLVDNFTAYWLYFKQADQYCPPFTAGWSAPFILNMAGYGYMEIQTPFGRTVQTDITPNVSQYVAITWSSDSVAYNPGIPSAGGSSVDPQGTTAAVSQVLAAQLAIVVLSTAPSGLTQLVAGIDGKRLNLLTFDAYLPRPDFGGGLMQDSGADIYLTNSVIFQPPYANAYISPQQPNSSRVYPFGLPWSVGEPIMLGGSGVWADVAIGAVVTYQVID